MGKKKKTQKRIVILRQTDIEQIFPRSKGYLGIKMKEKSGLVLPYGKAERKKKERWFEIFTLFCFILLQYIVEQE